MDVFNPRSSSAVSEVNAHPAPTVFERTFNGIDDQGLVKRQRTDTFDSSRLRRVNFDSDLSDERDVILSDRDSPVVTFHNDSLSLSTGVAKPPAPSKFTGEENFDEWWLSVCDYLSFFAGSECYKSRLVNTMLAGPARAMLHHTNSKGTMTLKMIENFLRDTFTTQVNWNVELSRTKQQAGESVKSFAARLKLVLFKGHNEMSRSAQQDESDFRAFFLMNTLPDLQARLKLSMPATSNAAVDIALQWEEETKNSKNAGVKTKSEGLNALEEPYKNDIDNRFKQLHVKFNNEIAKQKSSIKEDTINAMDNSGRGGKRNRQVSFGTQSRESVLQQSIMHL
jgi:hypothetical protein